MSNPGNQQSLEDQVGDLRTSVRTDLEITRRFERGEPIYVIHDPIGFTTQTFTVQDYLIVGAIHPEFSLREIFQSLVAAGRVAESEKEDFYRFVLSLRKLNLLGHSGASGKELYEKNKELVKSRKKGGVMKWMMPKIPLVNPDAFLSRTLSRVNWLFSGWFVVLWLGFAAAAVSIVMHRLQDFTGGLNGILATKNLPFVWGSFILVKMWHELGHGYACKRYGGVVPEMGTMFMLGTPLAYVDASAAWGFDSRWKRLVVMLGGMYFESMIAILAVFVWAFADGGLVGSCAFQLILMTSVTTILFNANPLMRYDGYYVFAELTQVPNLRQLASTRLKRFAKRWILGIKQEEDEDDYGWMLRTCIFWYAVGSGIYANVLTFSVAAMLAYALPTVGVALAAYYCVFNFGGKINKLVKYLWSSEEVAPVKWRARLALVCFLGLLPASLVAMPTPFRILTVGVLTAEQENIVRAEQQGILSATHVRPGQFVQPGAALASLQNVEVESEYQTALAELRRAEVEFDCALDKGQEAIVESREALNRQQRMLDDAFRNRSRLDVRAAGPGKVTQLTVATDVGKFLEVGQPIATLLDGDQRVRTYLTEKDLLLADVAAGKQVGFAIAGESYRGFEGTILDVSVVSELQFKDLALTQLHGGEILVDPNTQTPTEPLFSILIDASAIESNTQFHGRRINVFFQRRYEPFGWYTYRKLVDFLAKLYVA